jgi:hypothetical protein
MVQVIDITGAVWILAPDEMSYLVTVGYLLYREKARSEGECRKQSNNQSVTKNSRSLPFRSMEGTM